MKIVVRVNEHVGVARTGEPVELGLPLPPGAADGGTSWAVSDDQDRRLPSQFKPLVWHPDGSLRAVHGVFLADLPAGVERILTVAPVREEMTDGLVSPTPNGWRVDTGPMQAELNERGELLRWRVGGVELLDGEAGPSLRLDLGLGPAGGRLSEEPDTPRSVQLKENGPVRAVLGISSAVTLHDRRGPFRLAFDADYVFYAGRSEIHVRPMLVGAITDTAVLNEWSLLLRLRNGGRLIYGRALPLVREDPNHEFMTWRGLDEGWVSWQSAGGTADPNRPKGVKRRARRHWPRYQGISSQEDGSHADCRNW